MSAPPPLQTLDAPIAAFDLDGTITWADAFTSFLRFRHSRASFWARAVPLVPLFPAYLLRRLDRRRLKERFATAFLGGVELAAVEKEIEDFWAGPGAGLLRTDALAELERRRAEGLRIIIVTACPALVVAPLARRLRVELIGTRLEVADGRITGRIEGENCRGREKVVRIGAHCGPDVRLKAAYGDSSGDLEMLAEAEEPAMKPFRDGPPFPLAATIALWF
jgi:phosphatidylglycerophosphatase C